MRLRTNSPTTSPARRRRFAYLIALLLLTVPAACRDGVSLFERPRAATAHERYAGGLDQAGLATTALGSDWLAAANQAVRAPLTVTLPFREAGYFAATEAHAVGYAVSLRAGQRLVAAVETQGTPFLLFLDLFRQTGDTAQPVDLVASADSAVPSLSHEARRDGVYILRLQPELLRSGRYTVTVSTEPTLAFPVAGRDSRAVKSFFGADRDGGIRRHHGIDIFAPRGTPVVAATRGVVRSITPNTLGGNVVWLSDYERGQSLYYAHLDRHAVAAGQAVEVGDTLGFVGNTGNAATTAPHLHFGVYRRGQGPLDPYPFVHRSTARPPRIAADTSELGTLARSVRDARVVASPDGDGEVIAQLARATPLRIDAAAGSWYRVRLPDGTAGYVQASRTEPADDAVRRAEVAAGTLLRDRPAADAAVISTVDGGRLPVLGVFSNFALVEAGDGKTGWVTLQ